jgi:hypothetical protein
MVKEMTLRNGAVVYQEHMDRYGYDCTFVVFPNKTGTPNSNPKIANLIDSLWNKRINWIANNQNQQQTKKAA